MIFSVRASCSTSQRCSSCPGERQTSRSHFIFMETSGRVMASGISFLCGVALNQHLNPCPYTAVPNLAGMELVPQSGARACPRLYSVPSHPSLAAALPVCLLHSLLSGVPGPFRSPRALWGEATRSQSRSGKVQPPMSRAVSVCLSQLLLGAAPAWPDSRWG